MICTECGLYDNHKDSCRTGRNVQQKASEILFGNYGPYDSGDSYTTPSTDYSSYDGGGFSSACD